jgi:hypothetical protein
MSKKGSTIIWVVSVLMIFTILVTGILVLVGSTHRSALYNNHKQQAYFSALSAADALAESICQGEENFIPTPSGVTWSGYTVQLLPNMGNVDIQVTRDYVRNFDSGIEVDEDMEMLLIEATATYLGVADRVTVYLNGKEGIWRIWKYGN